MDKPIKVEQVELITKDFQNSINTLRIEFQEEIDPMKQNIIDLIGLNKALEEII